MLPLSAGGGIAVFRVVVITPFSALSGGMPLTLMLLMLPLGATRETHSARGA